MARTQTKLERDFIDDTRSKKKKPLKKLVFP